MFSSSVVAFVLALPLLSAAAAVPEGGIVAARQASGGQCNTGPVLCCNSVQNATAASVVSTANMLGAASLLGSLGSALGLVGLTCNPINIIGAGGTSCGAQPVCCSNNQFNGLLVFGCSPIIL
ncbi:hypothetical protein HGRIS_010712 [Hohenbuehelia grisea]|uniref:Hydrophobin n=1 Tax=Hohenbuehelia grisea TaxID=104357 RepID=A0ABR3IXJ6_9AGAR